MDHDTLTRLAPAPLADYLRCRLRQDRPLDPPLWGPILEPVESFIVEAARANAGFRPRLIAAIRQNLATVQNDILAATDVTPDAATIDHIAGLAYLATALRFHDLCDDFQYLAAALIGSQRSWGQALSLSLRAVLQLGEGRFHGIWRKLIDDPRPTIREVAYLGLARAAPAEGLAELPRILRDMECNLPLLLYNMAMKQPGIDALAQAAQTLANAERQTLREALAFAGLADPLLSRIDAPAPPDQNLTPP